MVHWEQQCSELLNDYSALLCYYSYQSATRRFDCLSCIFHSTLPTSFACISSETFEVRFIECLKMRSSCLGWKGEKAFFSEHESSNFLPCWISPIHSERRGTSNYISIGTGTVATSQTFWRKTSLCFVNGCNLFCSPSTCCFHSVSSCCVWIIGRNADKLFMF